MSCACQSDSKKLMHTIKAVILFLIFSSPATYKVTRRIFGGWVANTYGLSSTSGLLVHAAIFGLVIYMLMKVGSTSSRYGSPKMSPGKTSQDSISGLSLDH